MINNFNKFNESIRDKMTPVTKDSIGIENIDNYEVAPLLEIGFTEEEILQNKKRYKQNDLSSFSKENIKKYDLLDKIEISGHNLIELGIDKSQVNFDRIIPNTLDLMKFMDKFGFTRKEIENNIDKIYPLLDENSKYLYDKYLNKKDSELNNVYNDIMYGNSYADHKSKDHYSLSKTLFIIDWFDINPSKVKLNDLKEAFDRLSTYQVTDVYKILKDKGYFKTENAIEIFNFFNDITRSDYSFNKIDLLHQLFKAGVDGIDKITVEYFLKKDENGNYVRNSGSHGYITTPLDNTYGYTDERKGRKQVEEILGSKYKDAFEKIVYYDDLNEFVKQTLAVVEFAWGGDRNKPNLEQWLEKYGLPNVDVNWKDIIGRYKYEALMSYIILMAYHNKIDELYKLKGIDWNKDGNQHRGFSDGTILEQLSEVITNTAITNHNPTYKIEDKLNGDQRYKLYDWVMKDISPEIDEEHEQDLQLLYFIWDRRKLNNLIEKIKKEHTIIDAFDQLKPLFDYLIDRKYSDTFYYKEKRFDRLLDLKYYLNYFLQGYDKLTPKQIESLEYYLIKKSHYSGDTDYYKSSNKIVNDILGEFKSKEEKKGAVIGQRIRESKVMNFNKFVREKIQVDYFEKNPDFYLSKNKKEIEEEREEQKELDLSIKGYEKELKNININDIKFKFNDGEYRAVSPSFLTPNFSFYKTHLDDGFVFRTNKHTEYNYKIILAFIKYLKKPTLIIEEIGKNIITPLFKEMDDYYAAAVLKWSSVLLFLTKDIKKYKEEIKLYKENEEKILYTNYKTKGKELTDYETIELNKLRNKLKNISYEDISFKPNEDGRYYNVLLNGENLPGFTFMKEGSMGSNKVYFGHLKNRFHVSGGLREELKGIGLGYKIYKAFLKHNGYLVSDEQTSIGARKMYYNLLKDDDVLHVIDREVEDKGVTFGKDTEKVLLVWKDHPKLEKLMRIVRKHELKNNRKYKYDKELLKYIKDVKL